MAFRRFKRFSRAKPRFSSARTRVHKVTRLGRWGRANFSIIQETVHTDVNDPQNIVSIIAQIMDHLGDQTTAPGRLAANQIRALEVGGIVFDWQVTAQPIAQLEANSPNYIQGADILTTLVLATDRLDVDGFPVAISTNWYNNTTPIPLAVSTGSDDDDTNYPTRWHWRTSRLIACGTRLPVNTLGSEFLGTNQAVVLAHGSKNLRLRLSLSDEQTLCFHWSTRAQHLDLAQFSGITTTLYLNGTLYWKARD